MEKKIINKNFPSALARENILDKEEDGDLWLQ
jgi:hypothetical protein